VIPEQAEFEEDERTKSKTELIKDVIGHAVVATAGSMPEQQTMR